MIEVERIIGYLHCDYKDGARGPKEFDCWGLVRDARTKLYKREMLPEFAGELRFNPAEFTRNYREQAKNMVECTAKAGAIAAILKRGICVHVALITHDIGGNTDKLYALEINPEIGARYISLRSFERAYSMRTIKYYDDKDLP